MYTLATTSSWFLDFSIKKKKKSTFGAQSENMEKNRLS